MLAILFLAQFVALQLYHIHLWHLHPAAASPGLDLRISNTWIHAHPTALILGSDEYNPPDPSKYDGLSGSNRVSQFPMTLLISVVISSLYVHNFGVIPLNQ